MRITCSRRNNSFGCCGPCRCLSGLVGLAALAGNVAIAGWPYNSYNYLYYQIDGMEMRIEHETCKYNDL